MSFHDWMLALHLLAAFSIAAALVLYSVLVVAGRRMDSLEQTRLLFRVAPIGGPLIGAGMVLVLVLGIVLAIDSDDFQLWDVWVIAAIVLWALLGEVGRRSGVYYTETQKLAVRPDDVSVALVVHVLGANGPRRRARHGRDGRDRRLARRGRDAAPALLQDAVLRRVPRLRRHADRRPVGLRRGAARRAAGGPGLGRDRLRHVRPSSPSGRWGPSRRRRMFQEGASWAARACARRADPLSARRAGRACG